jgi:hypothetical protein
MGQLLREVSFGISCDCLLTTLIVLNKGTLTGQRYINEMFTPRLGCKPDVGNRIILMDDNARLGTPKDPVGP